MAAIFNLTENTVAIACAATTVEGACYAIIGIGGSGIQAESKIVEQDYIDAQVAKGNRTYEIDISKIPTQRPVSVPAPIPVPISEIAGASEAEAVEGGSGVVKEYDIVTYKPSNKEFGFENHHGVMDVWAKNNIPGYESYDKASPTMTLTPEMHNATRSEFIKWRIEQTGSPAGKIDWTQVSSQEIQNLTERMFDSANVPQSARQEYYSAFNKYIYGLI